MQYTLVWTNIDDNSDNWMTFDDLKKCEDMFWWVMSHIRISYIEIE